MALPHVLAVGDLPDQTLRLASQKFTVLRSLDRGVGAKTFSPVERNLVRGVARGLRFPLDADWINQWPKLEIIAIFGVGYDDIDVDCARGRDIVVTNTPDVLTDEVADAAVGLLIMTVRQFRAADAYLRAGKWASFGPFQLTSSLRDRTMGILGLGRIGQAVARRFSAMDLPVVYCNRHPRCDVPYRYFSDVLSMAEMVDTLVITAPGGSSTVRIVDGPVLRALGPNGVVVNVGRGSIIDEAALIDALSNGKLLAAGLDVFAIEPEVNSDLLALPNVVLLPHVGSATVATFNAIGALMLGNLTSWFDTGRTITPIPILPARTGPRS